MPEQVKGHVEVMESFMERGIKELGFVLIHDGSKEPQDIKWLNKPTFFTRTYRLKNKKGQWENVFIRFTYDLRTGNADFSISFKDLAAFQEHVSRESKEQAINVLGGIPNLGK